MPSSLSEPLLPAQRTCRCSSTRSPLQCCCSGTHSRAAVTAVSLAAVLLLASSSGSHSLPGLLVQRMARTEGATRTDGAIAASSGDEPTVATLLSHAMDRALDIGDAYLVLGAADDRAASSEGTALLNNDHALQSSPAAALAMYNRSLEAHDYAVTLVAAAAAAVPPARAVVFVQS